MSIYLIYTYKFTYILLLLLFLPSHIKLGKKVRIENTKYLYINRRLFTSTR